MRLHTYQKTPNGLQFCKFSFYHKDLKNTVILG